MQAAGVKVIFASLTGDVLLDMLVAALFTILCYSSLAVVLLMATLASLSMISLPVALGLVLGANLGSGLLGMLSTLRSPPEARRVHARQLPVQADRLRARHPAADARRRLDRRTGARPGAAKSCCSTSSSTSRWRCCSSSGPRRSRASPSACCRTSPRPTIRRKPRNLDPSALDTPPLAIANAAREAMRIGDVVEDMLNGMLTVLKTNDRALAERLRKKDDVVDDLYTAVKLYLTQISREALDESEGRRWTDIVSFTINLEQVGDIIERVLTDIEEKKIEKHRSFSDAGMAEICDLHARLVANLRLGMSVFLHGDLKSAQELLAQKVLFRDLERAYADSHLGRLAGNTLESIETSSLHLDLISDLKRINSHICSIAYPILEQAGVLRRTRLKEPDPRRPTTIRAAARARRQGRLAEAQAAHRLNASNMALTLSDICIAASAARAAAPTTASP